MDGNLSLPYLSKIDQRGDLQVWTVDGAYVRSHINGEFTQFGQHHHYPFIPENELWIDQETHQEERGFLIDHLLVENELMAKGIPYQEALPRAEQVARRERRRAGGPDKAARSLIKPARFQERLWRKLTNGISVWIVKGELVRSALDAGFSGGGHDCIEAYIPPATIWIDDSVPEMDWSFILLHELHERNQMEKGVPYCQAHIEASRMEYRCRHHPGELHDALTRATRQPRKRLPWKPG
jgi:hypothetical protein